jgi:hypothetical protein
MTGLFYVIEGFLDILLPNNESINRGTDSALGNTTHQTPQKLLFTVKSGGIAGYLGGLSLVS